MKSYFLKPELISHPLQMLMRYKSWALDITLQSVSKIPNEELVKVRPTTFKTIIHTLNHIYVVDEIFKAHLENHKHHYASRNTEDAPSLESLQHLSEVTNRWYIQYADQYNQDELAEIIEFEFVGGGTGAMSRLEILHHLVNHATYHIGYVSDMMYQIPAEPPATDLPVFLRDIWQSDKRC